MSFFGQISETWQAVVHLIIRPPRHEYSVNRDLGPKCSIINGKLVIREDLELMNPRGLVLKCSHFQPAEPEEDGAFAGDGSDGVPKLRPRRKPFPCVVYCHGNAGSRVDAMSLLPVLLPADISVFCFDFSGAGQSEGKFLSLGHYEKDDLGTVVDYLKGNERVTRIGLWGHSMGACTCLLYAADGGDQVASAMVLDSSFVSLDVVIAETAASAKQKLAEHVAPAITLMPDMFIPMAVAAIRRSIQNQAEYDIRDVNPLSKCEQLLLPALFGHAEEDEMIAPYHSLRLHEAYGGNSTMIRFDGRHNTPRSPFFISSALHFLGCILDPQGNMHPAHSLVYHNASQVRGLLAGSASSAARRTTGKGFRSHGMSEEGDRCFHIGRTAGNLSLLVKMCLECNPELRKERARAGQEEAKAARERAARRRAIVEEREEGEREEEREEEGSTGEGGSEAAARKGWEEGGREGGGAEGEGGGRAREGARGGTDAGAAGRRVEEAGGAAGTREGTGKEETRGAGVEGWERKKEGGEWEEDARRDEGRGGEGGERGFDWEDENDDGGVAWGQPDCENPLLPSFHLCNIDGNRRGAG